jgi:hypothetical protein
MSLRGNGTSGIIKAASFDVIYAEGGVGKSTMANEYPAPIYFDINNGTDNVEVRERYKSDKVPNLSSLKSSLESLYKDTEGFKSVVIDCHTDVDKYIIGHILGDKYEHVSDIPHGKGYDQITKEMEELLDLAKALKNEKKLNIVWLAHAVANKFQGPEDPNAYDRIDIFGSKRTVPYLKAAADNVFFLKTRTSAYKDDKTGRVYTATDGMRVLVTEWRPTCYCKNRNNLPYEIELPKGQAYATLMKVIEANKSKSSDELIAEINAIMEKADPKTKSLAVEKRDAAGKDPIALMNVKAGLLKRVSEAVM